MPVCMCPCVSGGGGAVAHLLAPLLFGVGAHGAGKCVPGAPCPGREAGEPDAEPAGGDVGLGSQPPRHKDKLPNRSTTACWHGKAVVRGTTVVRPALLDCLRHRWCCHAGWVRLPTAEGVPCAGGGAPGRRECFPAQGATGASCTGCGATARVDEGAQRAPHPNGLSVGRGGRGRLAADWPPRVTHNCTTVQGVVPAQVDVLRLEGCTFQSLHQLLLQSHHCISFFCIPIIASAYLAVPPLHQDIHFTHHCTASLHHCIGKPTKPRSLW